MEVVEHDEHRASPTWRAGAHRLPGPGSASPGDRSARLRRRQGAAQDVVEDGGPGLDRRVVRLDARGAIAHGPGVPSASLRPAGTSWPPGGTEKTDAYERDEVHAVANPAISAAGRISSASRLLPIPGSPTSATISPRPSRASSSADSSASSSARVRPAAPRRRACAAVRQRALQPPRLDRLGAALQGSSCRAGRSRRPRSQPARHAADQDLVRRRACWSRAATLTASPLTL